MKNAMHPRLRILTSALGYVLTCVGVLSIFTIPFYVSLILLASGAAMTVLSSPPKLPMTRYSLIVWIAGCAAIIGILACFGQETIRQWRPFPGTYIPAWFVAFYGFRNVRHLLLLNEKDAKVAP